MVNRYQYREHDGVTHECGLKELRRLVSRGKLSVSAELRELDEEGFWGPWREARSHASLTALFNRAMWDGWNAQDEFLLSSSDKQLEIDENQHNVMPSSEEETLGVAIVEKTNTLPINQSPQLPKLPPDAFQQLEDLSESEENIVSSALSLSESKSSGSVPTAPDPGRQPSQFWKPEVSLREQQHLWLNDQPVQRKPQFNLVRLLILVLPPLLILWAVSGYIKQESTSTFSPLRQETTTGRSADVSGGAPQERLDAELKNKLRAGVQPMSPKASIDNALMVECLSSGLDLLSSRSKITDWRGRKRDQPKVVKIDVTIQSTGEMEFELAMFAMIVGKYIEHYTIEVTDILVRIKQDSDIYEFDMDSLDALQLYSGEQSAMNFLSNFL